MKNITVALDEETYRLSRIRAAEAGTSVSALVREFLVALTSGSAARAETPAESRGRLLREVVADFDRRGVGLRMADNLSRDALYRDREPTAGGHRATLPDA